MSGRLDGERAIVTGAARGIGAAVARRLASEGADVVVADVLDDDGRAVADVIGGRFRHLDVRAADEWAAVVADAESDGPLTILVNNAGIIRYGPLEDMSPDDFRMVLDVNLVGTFLGLRAAVPAMRRAGRGAIVNLSSTCGLHGSPFLAAYTASKWGIRGLTKTAAIELARAGIRVNSVHPGAVDTAMTRGESPPGEIEAVVARNVPIGRMAAPDEVAGMVAYLVSSESAFCTGGEYAIDGGYTAGDHFILDWAADERVAP
ncbi:MAG: 3-alpha(or 20-beta)-hydroxysteroid dehydrogenase [Acidimicrobiales bacterium]|jgi:3alpha(or 20beta)-hydroxysteroid dehydrogenase|nr:3-alpha(or 20-beta)-hydroxysteroid dehydrogenase [Acidimicrobiales bacterium]